MNRILRSLSIVLGLVTIGGLSAPLSAQNDETPYWASLRASEVNMRVGPSMDYRIDWVYRRQGLPVRVLRVMDGWRLIEDPDGTQGWVAQRMISTLRSGLIFGEGLAGFYERPDVTSSLRWNLEPGVVGSLGDCREGWCEFDVDGRTGFVEAARIWGAGSP